MFTTVDYLVVCSNEIGLSGEMGLIEFLTEMLKSTLEAVDDEPPVVEELEQHINIRYTTTREDGRWTCGFSVTFDSAEGQMEDLINNFSEFVADCEEEGIKHLLKLNDPQLRRTLRDYGDEIFQIEMKLREALSLIFVNAYENFYDLLKETNVTPSARSDKEQMQKSYENQFFLLVFSQYKQINNRKLPELEKIFEYIRQAEDFDGLQQMITTKRPITERRYTGFLASLKNQVEWIEKLRNCVAHNKSIPEDIIVNYETEKATLLKEIDKILNSQANHEVNDEIKP